MNERTTIGPPENGAPPGRDPADDAARQAEQELVAFQQRTEVAPPPNLSSDIRRRIAGQPAWTPPRMFLSSLRSLDLRGLWHGFVLSARTVVSPQTRSLVLRGQALVLVLIVAVTATVGGAAAMATAGRVIDEVVVRSERERATPAPARSEARSPTPVDGSGAGVTGDGAAPPGPADGASTDAVDRDLPEQANEQARTLPEQANDRAREAPRTKSRRTTEPGPNAKANDRAREAPRTRVVPAPDPKPKAKAGADRSEQRGPATQKRSNPTAKPDRGKGG